MKNTFAAALALAATVTGASAEDLGSRIQRLRDESASSLSQGVVVPADVALVHTTQLLPDSGADDQIASVLAKLAQVRKQAGPQGSSLVKINAYVRDAQTARLAEKAFAKAFPSELPAVCFVQTTLPDPMATFALDAVFAVGASGSKAVERSAHAAVLPPGGAIYIAGQAEKADDLETATIKTLESLKATTEFMGLDLDHVVSVKAFLTPMMQAAVVTDAAKKFFGDRPVPISLVEWESTLPIEIEMIVADPGAKSKQDEGVTYHTPPGMTASPVYSRLARVSAHPVLYVSGLYGDGDATKQVRDIFASLDRLAAQAGSDLRHLAKATYYVSADDVSNALNKLRPDYYDPKRPPAASKAMVKGVGREGKTIVVDMIAVVAKP